MKLVKEFNEDLKIILELNKVFKKFISKESFLLKQNLSERCLVHKVAILFLQACEHRRASYKFQNTYLDVDCEYNRFTIKQAISKKSTKAFEKTKLVIPDIIIHKRGTSYNLIAFEFKKSASVADSKKFDDYDRIKAKKYINKILYKYSAVINFPPPQGQVFKCELFKASGIGTRGSTVSIKLDF